MMLASVPGEPLVPIEERFSGLAGTVLGVQARSITGISTITLDGLRMFQVPAQSSSRAARLLLTIDGEQFELKVVFSDETLEARTLDGHLKKRNRRAIGLL